MNPILVWAVILLGLVSCAYQPKSRRGDRIWLAVTAVWLITVGLALVSDHALPVHFV